MNIYKKEPKSGNPPKNIIFFLHGLGANGQDLIGIAEQWCEAFPNTLFLSPDAPEPCDMAPMGYQWFSLQDRSPDRLLQNVQAAAPAVDNLIDTILNEHGLEPNKLALVGFSQGGMMSMHVALRRPEALWAVLSYSGALIESPSMGSEIKSRPPVFLRHGEADDVVPVTAFHHAKTALKKFGIEVEGETVPGMSHGIDPKGLALGSDFLTKNLSKDSLQ